MGWLDKLFGKDTSPANAHNNNTGINFGRYSDNNKSLRKTQRWYDAEDAFKAKKYPEAFRAFFDYLRDAEADNVQFDQQGDQFTFQCYQGSKIVRGKCDGQSVTANVSLAKMPTPSAAVMRRMLEMNYGLYYSRTALQDELLCMVFDSDVHTASPNKMYYGLKEIATKADRQDDMIVADFKMLESIDDQHVIRLPAAEVDIKFNYFKQWIQEAFDKIDNLNKDSFSGGISYLLLAVLYRIDYLIAPEAKLLGDLEKIIGIYWNKKDDIPATERNQRMQDEMKKLLEISRDDFEKCLYRTKSTFAVSAASNADKIKETITNSNTDSDWYIRNKYNDLALVLNEYGLSFCQYTYSLPSVMTELFHLYMMIIHSKFFTDLGQAKKYYNPLTHQFDKGAIQQYIQHTIEKHKEKFPRLRVDYNQLKFDTVYTFGISFSNQIAHIDLSINR